MCIQDLARTTLLLIPKARTGGYLKACSQDLILRIRFLVPKIGSRRSYGPMSRFRFCGKNVGRSFVVCSQDPIFRTNKESSIWRQNDHRDIMQILKIEHVLFPSVFAKLRIRMSEGHFQCVHAIRFSEPTKIGSLKNGTCERAFTSKHFTMIFRCKKVKQCTKPKLASYLF